MGSDPTIDWKAYTLEELTTESPITYGVVKPGAEGTIPFVRGGDISNGQIKADQLRTITSEVSEQYKRTLLRGGELVVSLVGNPGQVAQVPKKLTGANIARQVALVRIGENADPDFIRYALTSSHCQLQLTGYTMGSVQQVINLRDLKKIEIPLPPLPEQKAIAHVLGTLDDKIELNRQMNATLEGMAQALFKSWFVDFDPVLDNAIVAGNPIPDAFAQRAETRRKAIADGTANREAAKPFPAAFEFTDELGWIPEGWEVLDVEAATSEIIDHRGKTPKKLGGDWVQVGYPAVSAKNIKNGQLVRQDTIRFTDEDLYRQWMTVELSKGDVLMTSEAPLGEKLYLPRTVKWVLSQRLFALRANDRINGLFLYFWLDTDMARADIDGRASGTTVQGIRQSELRKVKVLAPGVAALSKFAVAADSIMEKRADNNENTETLTNLRDTLLPKLISGEFRIPEAEKLAQEAVA